MTCRLIRLAAFLSGALGCITLPVLLVSVIGWDVLPNPLHSLWILAAGWTVFFVLDRVDTMSCLPDPQEEF